MSICLVDTSIVCEVLKVPNRCGNHRKIYAQMEGKIRTETLLLPMSAIIETGNAGAAGGRGGPGQPAGLEKIWQGHQGLQGRQGHQESWHCLLSLLSLESLVLSS